MKNQDKGYPHKGKRTKMEVANDIAIPLVVVAVLALALYGAVSLFNNITL